MKKYLFILPMLAFLGVGCTYNQSNTTPTTIQTNSGVYFDIPAEWTLEGFELDTVRVVTETSPYKIVEAIQINQAISITDADALIEQTPYGKLYLVACGGAIACYELDLNGAYFTINWLAPESTQPVPTNLDGIWVPDRNFTRDDILAIMRTFRLEK